MAITNYQEAMAKIKTAVKFLFIASLILGIASIILLVCFNFAGVTYIQTLPGTAYEDGFTYPGWQLLYWGVGRMIIQGYNEYTFNIWNCIGLFLPLITLIVTTIMYLNIRTVRGTNKKKAILEFVAAATLVIGSIMLFNCDKFAIANAAKITGQYQNYYTEYLRPALSGEKCYVKTIYPTIILLVGLLTALVKAGNGALLLLQKSVAIKAKAAATKAE